MRNAELEARNASLESELAASKAAQLVAKAEVEATLEQMKSVAVDAMLHASVELMEEFKAGQHVEWDPNLKISV